MKYVFVFAVFLVLLGLSSAASVSGRSSSLKNKLQRLQTARRENLLARRLQGLQRRDFGSGSGYDFSGGDLSDTSVDIDEMCDIISYIQEDAELFEAITTTMTEKDMDEFWEAAFMCYMMAEDIPFRRSLMEKLKTKAKK